MPSCQKIKNDLWIEGAECCEKKNKCMNQFSSCCSCPCKLTKADFVPPVPTDFIPGSGLKKTYDFIEKGLFYDSKLATEGEIFTVSAPEPDYTPEYFVRNLNTNFGAGFGVPGPYPYTWPWSQWGGDLKYEFGTNFYSTLIDHFGHSHFFTMQHKISIKMKSLCLKTVFQDTMLQRIKGAGTQIFKWYAGLVDNDGAAIPYDVSVPAGALKGLMDYLITGKGSITGYLDTNYILGSFQFFKTHFFPASVPLQNEINNLTAYIAEATFNGMIPVLPWHKLFQVHQDGVYESFLNYRTMYNTCKSDKCYKYYKEMAIEHSKHMMDGGRQFGVFFGIFYGAISFLDIFLQELGEDLNTDPAIPHVYRASRVPYYQKELVRFWDEHVAMFEDFNKIAALPISETNEVELYRIQMAQAESCGSLGIFIGEVFRAFDKLIRYRNLYTVLPPTF